MTELFANKLTVCIDCGNLSGYLALAPTRAILDELDLEVGWLPMTSPLQKLSSQQPDEPKVDPLAVYKARRALAREKWAHSELERDCERLGISIRNGARQFESSLAGIGLMFVSEQRGGDVGAYLEQVYRRAFQDGADIEKLDEIVSLVGDETFRTYAQTSGRKALDVLQDQLLEAGVFSSPAYVLDGEVFQGRQHLNLIASYLRRDSRRPTRGS